MDSKSRRQVFSTLSAGTALAALGAAASSTATAAPPKTQSLTTFVSSAASGTGTGGFVGTFTLTGVNFVNGVLSAVGRLTGNVLNSAGTVVAGSPISQAVTAPLQVAGSCQILTLTLGPLHLDLLGLVVDLNQITLNITAIPGAGNLLGNLLCDVANLLNSGGPLSNLLTGLQGLLNQIIAAL